MKKVVFPAAAALQAQAAMRGRKNGSDGTNIS